MKKRTPFKNSNILLPALFALALLCALFASCENILDTIPRKNTGGYEQDASTEGAASTDTLTVSVRIGGSEARYAAPSADQKKDFVYAALLYPDGSPSEVFVPGASDAGGSTITFLFQKPPLADGEKLTLEIFAFASGTAEIDFSRESALLSGMRSGLEADGASMKVEALYLEQNASATNQKGTVSLKVKVPDGCALEIDDTANFRRSGTSPDYTIGQNGEAIQAKSYPLKLTLKKDGRTVSIVSDHINVRPDMLTDTWLGLPPGEVDADGARVLSEAACDTLYVRGAGGWYDDSPYASTATASDSNAGSFLAPFATIQKAIDVVLDANDGTSEYTIYVDGTFTASSDLLADFTSLAKPLTIKIVGLDMNDKAVLDGNNTSVIIAAVPNLPSHRNFDLTLENLVIKNGKNPGTGNGAGVVIFSTENNSHKIKNCEIKNNNAENGAAVYFENGSLYLENCTISDNNTTTSGTVYITATSSAILTMNDVTIENNTAGNGGGIFITGKSTVKISDKSVVFRSNFAKYGDEICVWNGNLELSGDTKIGGEIYLRYTYVTVTGALSQHDVATITPDSYTDGTKVLAADSPVLIDNDICGKFTVNRRQSDETIWMVVPSNDYMVGILSKGGA